MNESARFQPTHIKAPHGANVFEISWADGVRSLIPHDVLRGYCPCAGCQGHGGAIRFIAGGNLDMREIEQVGNYAVCFKWGDQHGSGLYSFRYLRKLADLVQTHGSALPTLVPELPRVL